MKKTDEQKYVGECEIYLDHLLAQKKCCLVGVKECQDIKDTGLRMAKIYRERAEAETECIRLYKKALKKNCAGIADARKELSRAKAKARRAAK